MFLSNFSIKQPVTTVAIIIVLMCLGLLALKNLRVNQIPDVENPVMAVNFPYPGASPETVEREIINRVEKSLQSIPQVGEFAVPGLQRETDFNTLAIGARTQVFGLNADIGASGTVGRSDGDNASVYVTLSGSF